VLVFFCSPYKVFFLNFSLLILLESHSSHPSIVQFSPIFFLDQMDSLNGRGLINSTILLHQEP
jgi:hypothetical protein